jgi:AraC-like DNA-binding protein
MQWAIPLAGGDALVNGRGTNYHRPMLRSCDEIRSEAPDAQLISSGADHAVVSGGGASYRTKWHWHDCLMILLPGKGAVSFRHEKFRSWLSAERFIVVPKLQAHETHGSRWGSHSHLALYLPDELLARMETQVGTFSRLRRDIRRPSIFAATPEIRTLQYLCGAGDSRDSVTRASRASLANALIFRILGQIERTDSVLDASRYNHGHAVVADICSFIRMHLADELPLDAVSRTFGLSRRHMTRLFRERTGYSVARYQQKLRIEAAAELLRGTTLPVGEIAWRVGFDSGTVLARAMQRELGKSPRDLRRG